MGRKGGILDTLIQEEKKVEVMSTPNPTTDEGQEKLEEAANLLLSQLTKGVKAFACEVADIVLKIPRWQLVVGSVLSQQESGCLQSPSIDPSWSREVTSQGERVCEVCGKTFIPMKPFQGCCSNECGDKKIGRGKKEEKENEEISEETSKEADSESSTSLV